MYVGLYKFILKKFPRLFHFSCCDERSIFKKSSTEIAESVINLACRLLNKIYDISVSAIILRTDNKKLNERGWRVNLHLKKLSKENKIFLTDNSRKIKTHHLNKRKLHLTKYGSRVLSDNFVNEIYKFPYWQIDIANLNANVEECTFKADLTVKKYDGCNVALKTISSDNVNKLIFAHSNISSIRNEFEVLAT